MKAPSKISLIGTLLLLTLALNAQAMISFRYTNPKQADELGIEVSCLPAGPDNVRIEISFLPKGKLKAFAKPQRGVRLDLRIEDGKKQILSAPLRESRAEKDGRVSVGFTIQRSQLKNASVWLIDYPSGGAEVLRLHEHVDLKKLDAQEAEKKKKRTESEGDDAPPARSAQ